MLGKCVIVAILCMIGFCCQLQAAESFKITRDGKRLDVSVAGVLKDGKVFLDIDSISKKLGVSVKMVSDGLLVLCVADRCVPVERKKKNGDVITRGDATFVSAGILASVVGCNYEYNAKNNTLSLREDKELTAVSMNRRGIQIGLPLPEFTLPALDGKLVSLRDFRGKRVAILMWASW